MTSHSSATVQDQPNSIVAETPASVPVIPNVIDDGLTVLFDNTSRDGPNLDIVFVHGLNGNAKTTWTHPKTKFYWPWELRSHLTKSRIMTFGYNASITSQFASNFNRIKGIAAALNDALANMRTTNEELSRPIVFVAHSLGGLVAKRAAFEASLSQATRANDLDKLYASISGFVFYGVPHGGSEVLVRTRVNIFQKIAKAAFVEIPPKLESALEQGSDELLDLADSFRQMSLYVEGKLIMASYYEGMGTAGAGGRIVDETSAAIHYPRANPPVPINADHINMVKFDGEENGYFQAISGLLKRWETRLTDPVLPSPPGAQGGHMTVELVESPDVQGPLSRSNYSEAMQQGNYYLRREDRNDLPQDIAKAHLHFSQALGYLRFLSDADHEDYTDVYKKLMNVEERMSYIRRFSLTERVRHLEEAMKYSSLAIDNAVPLGKVGRLAQLEFEQACLKAREVELDAQKGIEVQKVYRKRDEVLQSIDRALDELRSSEPSKRDEAERWARNCRHRLENKLKIKG